MALYLLILTAYICSIVHVKYTGILFVIMLLLVIRIIGWDV